MSLLLVVFWSFVAAVCVTIAVTVGVRVWAGIGRRRLHRYHSVLHDHLSAYVVGARDDPPAPPQGRFQQRVLRRDLVALMPNVKGEAAVRVADLFASSGLIDAARRDLDARDSLTRIRAAESLGAMRVTEAEPWLYAHLEDHDPMLRLACARALAQLEAVSAMPAIMAALRDVDAQPGEVLEVLLTFGPQGVEFLRAMLANGSSAERRLAVVALGHIGAHQALPDLRRALGAADDELVARAARALGQLGDSKSTAALIALLDHNGHEWFVAVAAAQALGALEDPSAGPALVDALDAEEWDVRNGAARSLVALGPAGLQAVSASLDTVSARGLSHFAGLLDVAGDLEPIIARAAAGDADLDRFVRQAQRAGVRACLDELVESSQLGPYATDVLAGSGVERPFLTGSRVKSP